MSSYKHTQIGYLMIFVTVIVAVYFGWVYIQTSSEIPEIDSSTNLLITIIMALIIFVLASFTTLTTFVDEKYFQIKFGYGIFKKKFLLDQITSVKAVKNPWYYGWGIKVIFWPYIRIYNVSGFDAVEIILKDGKIYRVGTDVSGELEVAIKKAINAR